MSVFKMAECCIIGCDNKAEKRGKVKFYALPTAKSSRPFKVQRRRLWLEAIEKANGTPEGLSRDNAQICCAHFVLGQMSLNVSDQDFIPSVFPKEHTAKSRRRTLRPRSGVLDETTPKKKSDRKPASAPAKKSNNIFLVENNYCEPLEDEDVFEPPSSQVIIEQQQMNVLVKEETIQRTCSQVLIEQQQMNVLVKEETIQPSSSQVILGQQQISMLVKEETIQPPSSQVKIDQQQITEHVKLKKPKLQIKSVVDRFAQYRCEVCNGKFPTASALVKHKQLHEQEWSDEDETLPTVSDFLVKSVFMDKPVSAEEPSFQCNMCNRCFPTIHILKRHKLLHVRDNRKCTQCGTIFCKRHNHVVAQPQISTETHFEEAEATCNNMDETAACPTLCLSDSDGVDKGVEVSLGSNSVTLEDIAAAREQTEPSADKVHKKVPAITYNPRKPGILTAFKSFLSKHKSDILTIKKGYTIPNPTTQQLQAAATCINTNAADPITTFTAPITTSAVPITTLAAVDPISTIAASGSITADKTAAPITSTTIAAAAAAAAAAPAPITASTMSMTAKSVPESSSKTDVLTTCTNALTAHQRKAVVYVAPGQKMDKPTLCVSFSKLPTNVIQKVMTYMNKNEKIKSQAPPLITCIAKQDQVIAKQEPEIASTMKLKQTVPEEPNSKKTTFIITSMPKSNLKTTLKIMPMSNPQTTPQNLPKLNVQTTPQNLPKLNVQTTPQNLKSPNQDRQFLKPTLSASSKWRVPDKRPYVHASRPPSPVPICTKIKRGPWDSPFPNYPKDFIQPHLPQVPKLPPTLQIFSPQFLTSAMLEVERNFEYILRE